VGEELSAGLKGLKPSPVLLVDENVLGYYTGIFDKYPVVLIPSGEIFKVLQTVENCYRELIRLEVDRDSLLVGVGGGLATDVAGFVASTFLREVRFGFISSTLLGQVDASIGGKNGVNLDGYKNMIGTIRQPGFVWCDLSLLGTLPRREYISGISEVIKYGAIMDLEFLEYLDEHMEGLLGLETGVLEKVVTRSATIKAEVVQNDEKESGLRRILNFGHTFGHAIERDKQVLHGEAVATGMVMAARLSHTLGMISLSELDQLVNVISKAGLPEVQVLDPEVIYNNIRMDKKKSGEDIRFVLLHGLGSTTIKTIPLSELKIMLHDLC
jgi:3-dehydroquinate synthase